MLGAAIVALLAGGATFLALRHPAHDPGPQDEHAVKAAAAGTSGANGSASNGLAAHEGPATAATAPREAAPRPSEFATAPPRTGPIRICVLPFKNVSGDASLDYLKDAIAESVTTDFGHHAAFRLIENTQINLDIDYLEQTRSKYVDPTTREQLGKIVGAEVVVLGAYQRAGKAVRANARFVQVATGEVLETVRVDKPATQLFELQDALAADLRGSLDPVARRLRP